ncbi:MAG: hypothetical protein H6581_17725 [Bacteroidia bacterium]|nr:hypothetical protein [Bacteroidia bacterium]
MKRSKFSTRPMALMLVLSLVSIMAWQCTSPVQPGELSPQTLVRQIQPAFGHLDVPRTKFEIDATTGGTISMPTGTVIQIPANAMVDAAGHPLTGRVEIDYREFHDAADLLLSGIPMKYDSSGKEYDFQTAGMMELNASQNGNEVFLASGQQIQVSLASFTQEEGYNLYFLNPENNNWEYLGEPQTRTNEDKKLALNVLSEQPLPPSPQNIREVTEAQMDLVFDFGVDYSAFPELKAFEGIKWEYAGGENELSKNEWAFSEVWTDVRLYEKSSRKGRYELSLSNQSKQFTMEVEPVVEGKNAAKVRSQLQKAMAEYEVAMEARTAEEKRIALQADMVRTFQVQSFGTYNCDRFYKRPDAVQVASAFKFEGQTQAPPLVYLVTGSARAVIPYNTAQGTIITFDPTEDNKLVAVVGGNKLAVFSQEDFNSMDLFAARKTGNYAFNMQSLPLEINTPIDLKRALGI